MMPDIPSHILPSASTLKGWAEKAESAWHVAQSYLVHFDPIAMRWLSPWLDDKPPLADGVPTLMATPLVAVGGIVVTTLFDIFGRLLQRALFRFSVRPTMGTFHYRAFETLREALPTRALLPAQCLIDVIGLVNGTARQRARHGRRLSAQRADVLVCAMDTMQPVGVVLWQPRGVVSRKERKRQRQVRRLCRKPRLAVWVIEVSPDGDFTIPGDLAASTPAETPVSIDKAGHGAENKAERYRVLDRLWPHQWHSGLLRPLWAKGRKAFSNLLH